MRLVIAFLFLLILPLSLCGQRTAIVIDSLQQELQKTPPGTTAEVDLFNDLGYRYWIVNSNESVFYGTQALELAEKLDYTKGIALAKRVLGVSYWTIGQPKLALENLTSGQAIYEEIGDLEGAANCLMNSGMVYADIGDLDKALDIYDRSIEKFTQLDLNRRIATTFTKIGSVLIQKNQLPEAKDYLTNALNMHSEDGYGYGISEAHNRLGILSLMQGELELAEHHIRTSMELGEEVNDEDGLISNLIQFGKLLRLEGKFEASEAHLKVALEKARNKQLKRYELGAYKELKLLKKQEGKLEESLTYYDTFLALKDSIYNTDKSKQIAAMEFGNELANKEKEIALLREKERANQIINLSLSLGGLGLSIIAFLAFKNHKQRTRRKQEILDRKQELLASREELAKTALENAHLKQKELKQQIDFKNKELTSYTLNFAQKNELLQELQNKIATAKNATPSEQAKLLDELNRSIRQSVNIDRDWEDFKRHFEEVHTDFNRKLKAKHPDLSANDLKICSLTRLNLNVKETASMLGISPESAKTARYRLRKKLDLQPEDELLSYFLELEKEN